MRQPTTSAAARPMSPARRACCTARSVSPAALEQDAGAGVQLGLELRLAPAQLGAEEIAEQVVEPVLLPHRVERHDEEVRPGELVEHLPRSAALEHRVARRAVEVLQHRDPGEELDDGFGKAVDQLVAQVLRNEAVIAREPGRRVVRVRELANGQRREVEAGGPAFGAPDQLVRNVVVQASRRRRGARRRPRPRRGRGLRARISLSEPRARSRARANGGSCRVANASWDPLGMWDTSTPSALDAVRVGEHVDVVEHQHERLRAARAAADRAAAAATVGPSAPGLANAASDSRGQRHRSRPARGSGSATSTVRSLSASVMLSQANGRSSAAAHWLSSVVLP